MALRKSVNMPQGFAVEDVYHRVESLTIQPKNEMSFVVRGYADVEKPSFYEIFLSCEYAIDEDNPIKQAYLYLKTLPEFEGAEDV